MPDKKEYALNLSKEEQMEINDLINVAIVTMSKQAERINKLYYRSDPNMAMLIFEHILQNFMLNLLTRVHGIEDEYCFKIQNILDEQMIKNGTKRT